jgi:hypothetical protein
VGTVLCERGSADGSRGNTADKVKELKPVGQWNRLRVLFRPRGDQVSLAFVNGKQVGNWFFTKIEKINSAFALRPEGEMDFANLYVRQLK